MNARAMSHTGQSAASQSSPGTYNCAWYQNIQTNPDGTFTCAIGPSVLAYPVAGAAVALGLHYVVGVGWVAAGLVGAAAALPLVFGLGMLAGMLSGQSAPTTPTSPTGSSYSGSPAGAGY